MDGRHFACVVACSALLVACPGKTDHVTVCVANQACTSANPCKVAATTCAGAGAVAVCTDTGNAPDGTACGTDRTCAAGACVLAARPTIASFTATPTTIVPGGAATLAWSVTAADALQIGPGLGQVTGTSAVVTPGATTTYTLVATNTAGAASATATVTVLPVPAIASFTATPPAIAPGGSAVLSWSVTGAAAVTIDQGVGGVTGTSVTVAPSSTTTYTLTATNAVGSASLQVTVLVRSLPSIAAFEASPSNVLPGALATLSWTATGADQLSIDQGIGAVTGTSRQVAPAGTTTYTLTAINAAGVVTASATVMVSSVTRVFLHDATVVVGRTVTMTPDVEVGTGTPSLELDWTVASGSLGTVEPARGTTTLYTAPFTPGRYQVWGASTWDPTQRDYCNVDVVLPPQFPVGTSPHGIAFDGASVWVTNMGSDTVTKLRASDGAVLGTYPVGSKPKGIVFDGSAIWVANSGGGTVMKLALADGAPLLTVSASDPSELAFDGVNVWVVSAAFDVRVFRALDGNLQRSYSVLPKFTEAIGIVGSTLWVASMLDGGTILDLANGDKVGAFSTAGLVHTRAILAVGHEAWVTQDEMARFVQHYRERGDFLDMTWTGSYTGVTVPNGGSPEGLAWDGQHFWVSIIDNAFSTGPGRLARFAPGDLIVTVLFDLGINPGAMLNDGQHLWIVNQGSNSVSRY